MEEIVEKALSLNKNFKELDLDSQYKFIIENINKDVIKQELVWYYNGQYGCPYEDYILKRKANGNTNRTFERVKEIKFNFGTVSNLVSTI